MAVVMFLMLLLRQRSISAFGGRTRRCEPLYRFFSPGGQLVAVCALALLFFSAFPFLWMGSTAFKDSREIFATPPSLWPHSFTLEHVERLFPRRRS